MLHLPRPISAALSYLSRVPFLSIGLPHSVLHQDNENKVRERKKLTPTEIQTSIDEWLAGGNRFRWDFSLDDLSYSTNIPRRLLLTYFRTSLRKDFRVWKAELRVEYAALLMKEDDTRPISEVAVAAGFKDKSNFHRQFKRIYGLTPRLWRDDHLDGTI